MTTTILFFVNVLLAILVSGSSFSFPGRLDLAKRRRQISGPSLECLNVSPLGLIAHMTVSPTAATTSSSSDPPSAESLTADKVAELVEVSFVNACLQLAQGFVDVLKLLIAAVKAGYEIGVSPSELIAKIDAIPEHTAGRPLLPEEIALRNTWIQVVYLTLASMNHPTKSATEMKLDDNIKTKYTPILPYFAARRVAGEKPQIDVFLEDHKEICSDDTPFQKAIFTQSLRAIWITLTVLEEEERCAGEFSRQSERMPPKPPIPGAF